MNKNPFHLTNLKKYARKLYPFLLKCYDMDQTSLEAFSGEYTYSFRDWNTGGKSTLLLREWIENLTEIKKLNGEKKYFKFKYL